MILVGCLSIFSGVVVSALYHHDKSKPVPRCLQKNFQMTPSKPFSKNSSPHKPVRGDNDASVIAVVANGYLVAGKNQNGSLGEVVLGKDDCLKLPQSDDKAKVVNHEDDVNNIKDYSADWRKLARSIDTMLLVVSSVLTVISVTITITLYVMVHE